MRKNKGAFTLAEVLITLGVMGIVAAMTLPAFVQKHNEKVIVSKLKKSYSTMQQAYLMAVKDKGTPDLWGLVDNLTSENDDIYDVNNFLYHLKDYLKIIKYCGKEAKGCWADTKTLYGVLFQHHENASRYSKAVLADGSNILTYVTNPECSGTSGWVKDICGFYRVDVNGNKEPNSIGRDVFTFYITKNRIVPAGSQMEANAGYSFAKSCRDSKTQEGRGCTAWVIYNENIDYLHCSDLSWDGKKTCK